MCDFPKTILSLVYLKVLVNSIVVVNLKFGGVVVLKAMPNQRVKATTVTLGSFVILVRVKSCCDVKVVLRRSPTDK